LLSYIEHTAYFAPHVHPIGKFFLLEDGACGTGLEAEIPTMPVNNRLHVYLLCCWYNFYLQTPRAHLTNS